MRQVRRSAQVPCAPDQVFALVADVAAYPDFVPWCEAAAAEETADLEQIATLGIRQGAFHGVFRTRNCQQPTDAITMELLEGPLRHLSGRWSFQPAPGGGCIVSLEVSFEFGSAAKDLLFGAVFESICSQLLDAVVAHARHQAA